MSETYGKDLKFICFDVNVGGKWQGVIESDNMVKELGLEFVDYVKIPCTLEAIDAERDKPSVQSKRNGIKEGKKREGVVLRPVIELSDCYGNRICVKHKGDDFKETKTPRKVTDPDKLKVLEDAKMVADEWVTVMRLRHVIDKFPNVGMKDIPDIIKAMVEDVLREGEGEIVESKDVNKAIGKKTAIMFKEYVQNQMRENNQ